eukprot:76067-Ditylum_brightwellii.AAC.1
MRGVSKVSREKFVRVGVEKEVSLKYLDGHNKTMESINNATNVSRKGLTVSVLQKLVNLICDAHEGNPP